MNNIFAGITNTLNRQLKLKRLLFFYNLSYYCAKMRQANSIIRSLCCDFSHMKYFKFILLSAIIITFCLSTKPVSAQNLPQNLSSVNVNNLSDAQIQQMVQQ